MNGVNMEIVLEHYTV